MTESKKEGMPPQKGRKLKVEIEKLEKQIEEIIRNNKVLRDNLKIEAGYVLEANESEEAGEKSYDDMTDIGIIRLAKDMDDVEGDDLDDTPFNCNGSILAGNEIILKKGYFAVICKIK
jgi:hypothetical protein